MKKMIRNAVVCALCVTCATTLAVENTVPSTFAAIESFAADTTDSSEASEVTEGVTFSNTVAQVGVPIETTLTTSLTDTPQYSWTVGNQKISNTSSSYTPTADDYEKMITVTVTVGSTSYSASMYFSDLPVVYVNTENNAEIASKEEYIKATCKIQGNASFTNADQLYDGDIKIKGRGNYTWEHPKKPYAIKLDDKTDILGMGANKHWALIAEYVDPTHIRNEVIPQLSEAMGMEYTAECQPVVLVLNGEYNGLYHLSENVRIGTARVNIFDWEDTASDIAKAIYKSEKENGMTKDTRDEIEDYLTENLGWITDKKFTYNNVQYNVEDYVTLPDGIDGGYLLELDTYDAYHTEQVSDFETEASQPIQFKSPEYAVTNTEIFDYAKNYIQSFENAVESDDYYAELDGISKHYSQMFDMDSLVQYWMMLEVTANSDGMRYSNYMYKDFGELFKIGPSWDYDWTWNAGYTVPTNEWWTDQSYYNETKHWYKYLSKDPYFITKAYELYQSVKPTLTSVYTDGGLIDQATERLSSAAAADNAKWQDGTSAAEEAETTKTYVKNRYEWLATQFSSVETLADSLGYSASDKLSVDSVTDDNGNVKITATVNDSSAAKVSFQLNGILVGEAEISNGTAEISVASSYLESDTSALNTVEIRLEDSNGDYMKSTSSGSNNNTPWGNNQWGGGNWNPWGSTDTSTDSEVYSNFTTFTANEIGVTPTAVKGDINADGKFDTTDLVLLQKWLLNVPNTTLAEWEAGDVVENDTLNGFDLSVMRTMLLEK